MAFSKRQLVLALEDWTERDDIAGIDYMITLATARINRDVRLYDNITSIVIPDRTVQFDLPNDYLQIDRIGETGVDNSRMSSEFYDVREGQIRFTDAVSNLTLHYYSRLPELESDDSTNYVLDNHPDLYIYYCLSLIYKRVQDHENSLVYENSYSKTLQEVLKDNVSKYGAFSNIKNPTRDRFAPGADGYMY